VRLATLAFAARPGILDSVSKTVRLFVLVAVLVGAWAALRKPTSSGGAARPDGGGTVASRETPPTRPEVDPAYPGLAQVPAGEEREAVRATLRLIDSGGPFPYPNKDGTVFYNRERRLPVPDGAYREYTVPTPGARDRGARRVISGARARYYTRDHYQSFITLRP